MGCPRSRGSVEPSNVGALPQSIPVLLEATTTALARLAQILAVQGNLSKAVTVSMIASV